MDPGHEYWKQRSLHPFKNELSISSHYPGHHLTTYNAPVLPSIAHAPYTSGLNPYLHVKESQGAQGHPFCLNHFDRAYSTQPTNQISPHFDLGQVSMLSSIMPTSDPLLMFSIYARLESLKPGEILLLGIKNMFFCMTCASYLCSQILILRFLKKARI